MTLEAIAVGLLMLAVGAAFCFMGFRFFLILLPIWGFFMGFIFGENTIHYLFESDSLFISVLGWAVGFVVGIVFAVLSYLYYWVAVVLLGAAVGYSLGLGLMAFLGNGGGLLVWIVGIIGAAIMAGIVVLLRVPRYLVLVLTAFGGAFAVSCGLALILGRVPLGDLSGGTVGAYVRDNLSWIWLAIAVVVGVVGFLYQARETARLESIAIESYRNPGMA